MHVLEVVRPVVQRGIEWERLALRRRRRLPQGGDVARVEDAVDLRVHAVELDEVDAALEPLAFRVEVVRHLGDARAERQPLDEPLRRLDHSQRRARSRRHLLASWIRPRRRTDRLPVAVAQRMLGEVGAGLVDNAAEAKRIPTARGRVINAWLCVWRWIRGHRKHRVDHEVGRDDVEKRVREA